MNPVKPATALERVAGSVVTESALTTVAALAGGPLAALLPVLAKSLASERQKARVEKAFAEVVAILEEHESQIRNLTDEQYKIINETVLALLHTTQTEKIKYLRDVVRNALTVQDVGAQEAIILSRIVRDISEEEIQFALQNFHHSVILLIPDSAATVVTAGILQVDLNSRDGLSVSGLISLGLLAPGDARFDSASDLHFTPIVAKLIALLQT